MFKGQPKGLYALSLANTGERFGYYTMLAIFTLFLQAKFGYTEAVTTQIYGIFLAAVYFMPFFGGILADKFGFGKMVSLGIFVMFGGYALLSIPTGTGFAAQALMFGALALIACGTGLFKGNLQVLVGNLYDDPAYASKRDNAFSIFYMAINIGAMFAPSMAKWITNYFLAQDGLVYNGQIPALAHQFMEMGAKMPAEPLAKLQELAVAVGGSAADLGTFSHHYVEKLSAAYNMGFGVACVSLVISYLIYVGFRKTFKHADMTAKQQAASAAGAAQTELTPAQTKSRITALMLVFAVVIFFWMAFHQNGSTMTFFARDYTTPEATGITRMGFDIFNLVLVIVGVYSVVGFFQSEKGRGKFISAVVFLLAAGALWYRYTLTPDPVHILPQEFQQFNPFYVVALTPISVAIFTALARKGKEPSAPRKIGMGMIIAAGGFLILTLGSVGLMSPVEVKAAGASNMFVSQDWLISTYLVLTFAELLLSPMGISFVSKVAPPKYKGMMMGCWFAATAIGNYATSLIGYLWGSGMALWMVWSVLIVLCLLSALFIFSIMRKLENATAA
ncbi:peptide MFS transporter [uncultured Alistipes sp.]|jgi:POT family proton-dependent oligopeptide transporter|uniref:peptide MFS transporter n=1 Tax=Alistipes sp. TaxID=1872444 RepID=UPI0025E13CFD|nr:peptide MFS transporter [uncultured Alistipes sp.]